MLAFFTPITYASSNRICLILDNGGKDDKSFNQLAYEGFVRAQKKFPLSPESKYLTVREDAQIEQFVRALSAGKCDLIIGVGFNIAELIGKTSSQFPDQKYVVIDAAVKNNNIRSIVFNENEGGYLMGVIAAIKSKTQKIGFIGGMEIPLIKRIEMGYTAGAKYINPKIQISKSFVGVTTSAWNNTTKAKELALSLYQQDNDIIFVAAGAASQGVFDAVQQLNKVITQNKKFIIGIDSNQNYIVPGSVLTSMEKKVNVEVYKAIEDFINQKFTTGVMAYGLKEGGISWSLDKYNNQIFDREEIKRINEIKKDIIDNEIHVPDYYKMNQPPIFDKKSP